MIKLLLAPFSSLWVILSLFFAYSSINILLQILWPRFSEFSFLFYGICSYIILAVTVSPKKYDFWNILFHEVSHAIFLVLTLANPKSLVVNNDGNEKRGGYVQYSFKSNGLLNLTRAHFAALAPYFFPMFTFLLFLIYLLVKPEEQSYFAKLLVKGPRLNGLFFLLGFTYGYHLVISISTIRSNQSDFSGVGFYYGVVFIIFMQLFFLLIFLVGLTYQFESVSLLLSSLEDLFFLLRNKIQPFF
jgi:hypothetical protein